MPRVCPTAAAPVLLAVLSGAEGIHTDSVARDSNNGTRVSPPRQQWTGKLSTPKHRQVYVKWKKQAETGVRMGCCVFAS